MPETRPTASDLFYAARNSPAQLLHVCNEICSREVPIFGATFATEEPLIKVLKRLESLRAKGRGFLVTGGKTLWEIRVPLSKRAPTKGIARGFVWQDEQSGLVHLLTLKDGIQILLREIQRFLLTDLTPVYLQTAGFQKCFDAVVDGGAVTEISIIDYTAWVVTDESKRAETRRVWLPEPLEHPEFFDKLSEEDQRIRSLGLIAQTGSASARGRIKRDLTFSCDEGFAEFFRDILGQLRALAAESRQIFLNRGADTSPTATPVPLQITYTTPVFEDKQQNRRLIRVLQSLPDAALSVFHPNPYLHASVIDYADGSSYAIWVTDNASISIVPEAKASAGSLERLCNHIAEHFGEGIVEELPA